MLDDFLWSAVKRKGVERLDSWISGLRNHCAPVRLLCITKERCGCTSTRFAHSHSGSCGCSQGVKALVFAVARCPAFAERITDCLSTAVCPWTHWHPPAHVPLVALASQALDHNKAAFFCEAQSTRLSRGHWRMHVHRSEELQHVVHDPCKLGSGACAFVHTMYCSMKTALLPLL